MSETEAVSLLRRSVHHAQHALSARVPDEARVNEVLTTLAGNLAAGLPHLHAVAEAHPLGPVAAVLAHLRVTFRHAADGRSDCAVTGLLTAAASAFRLADDTALDTLDAEARDARWNWN